MARWGKCDYKQLLRLQEKISEFNEVDIDLFCKKCAKELAARLLRKVIKRTPVGDYPSGSGKVGGTLRRGWTSKSEREAELNTVFNGKETGIVKYANSLPISKVGNEYKIEIINPVEYASYVEYGHRTKYGKGWIPGRFMLSISEKELNSNVEKIIEKKLIKFLGQSLNGK